jgi:SAM-dependent methyltransferase
VTKAALGDPLLCNDACIDFGIRNLSRADVHEKNVIEIGAFNVNGSLRQAIVELRPASYVGTDIVAGPGVDEVCDIGALAEHFGESRFDLLICTEVLEHIRDWRRAVQNMKAVLRPGGVMLVTTRSRGHPYHGYPYDFWRFELSDFEVIYGDFAIESLEPDPTSPGVFLKARKTDSAPQAHIASHALYSMVTKQVCADVSNLDIALLKVRHGSRNLVSSLVPSAAKSLLRRMYPRVSRVWRD